MTIPALTMTSVECEKKGVRVKIQYYIFTLTLFSSLWSSLITSNVQGQSLTPLLKLKKKDRKQKNPRSKLKFLFLKAPIMNVIGAFFMGIRR